MQFNTGLAGEAATLVREHGELFGRLPATVHAFIVLELQKWPALFPAERRYQRALLEHLAGLPGSDLQQAVSGIARVEAQAGTGRMSGRDPGRFQDEAQARLRKRRLLAEWRQEIDRFFQGIDPALNAQLYPAEAPRRLVVQMYAGEIAVQPDKLWSRFRGTGARVPLKLEGAQGSDGFLAALFGRRDGGEAPAFFEAIRQLPDFNPLDGWILESHQALHQLVGGGTDGPAPGAGLTGLSYDRLRGYRDDLTRALYSKIRNGVESPQAFAAYARSLKVTPAPGVLLHPADILQTFVRDVLLTGNGTLFVNNTFVEWAAVQALRRAQPRLLVARFGVRDKLKPFSSLLLFSQPRESDQIPMIEDPVGSFVDVEQLSYYVWLNAEKSPAYRNKTLYLFLAEGIDEMLAIRSDVHLSSPPAEPATLADVRATMAEWLGGSLPASSGRPIAALRGAAP
ncbi:MAG: hypothetical protein ACREUZ_14525 [Burkholderiales bacterium]